MIKNKILYFSYDGVLEPLGQSQIMNYQYEISKKYEINIVSFEKYADLNNINKIKLFKQKIKDNNITWYPLLYSKNIKYISFFLNFFRGFFLILNLLFKEKIKIIHCRGYVTYMIIFFLKYFFKFQILFDMRGFWVDERVEWSIWKHNKAKYFFFKFIEKKLLINANAIVTLTDDANIEVKKILKNKYQNKIFQTIHTCVNQKNYNIYNNKKIENNNELIFCHLGAISTSLILFEVRVSSSSIFNSLSF